MVLDNHLSSGETSKRRRTQQPRRRWKDKHDEELWSLPSKRRWPILDLNKRWWSDNCSKPRKMKIILINNSSSQTIRATTSPPNVTFWSLITCLVRWIVVVIDDCVSSGDWKSRHIENGNKRRLRKFLYWSANNLEKIIDFLPESLLSNNSAM